MIVNVISQRIFLCCFSVFSPVKMLCGDCGVVLWITSVNTSKRYHHTWTFVSHDIYSTCISWPCYLLCWWLTTQLNGKTRYVVNKKLCQQAVPVVLHSEYARTPYWLVFCYRCSSYHLVMLKLLKFTLLCLSHFVFLSLLFRGMYVPGNELAAKRTDQVNN